MELRIGITETSYKDVYNSVTQNSVEWEEYKVKVWHGKWDEVVTFTTLFQANTFVNFICHHYHLGTLIKCRNSNSLIFVLNLVMLLKEAIIYQV